MITAFVGLRYFKSGSELVPFDLALVVHDSIPLITFNLQIAIPEAISLPHWFNSYQSKFSTKGYEPGKAVKLLNDLVEAAENIYVTSPLVSRVLINICEAKGFRRKLTLLDVESIHSVIAGKPVTYKEIRKELMSDEVFATKMNGVYGALNDVQCLVKYLSNLKKS